MEPRFPDCLELRDDQKLLCVSEDSVWWKVILRLVGLIHQDIRPRWALFGQFKMVSSFKRKTPTKHGNSFRRPEIGIWENLNEIQQTTKPQLRKVTKVVPTTHHQAIWSSNFGTVSFPCFYMLVLDSWGGTQIYDESCSCLVELKDLLPSSKMPRNVLKPSNKAHLTATFFSVALCMRTVC